MYKQAHPEPVTPEQAEQMTLQWATRMGGVGANAAPTIIHTTDSEENPISVTNDRFDHEEALEELNRLEEERRINAEMDAEEAQLEEYVRDAQENPEPNNLEEE